jgi:hypothetical protein
MRRRRILIYAASAHKSGDNRGVVREPSGPRGSVIFMPVVVADDTPRSADAGRATTFA